MISPQLQETSLILTITSRKDVDTAFLDGFERLAILDNNACEPCSALYLVLAGAYLHATPIQP